MPNHQPLRYIAPDPIATSAVLHCVGVPRPISNGWVRAQGGSQAFLVEQILDHEHDTHRKEPGSDNFGMRLAGGVIPPWPLNILLEIVPWRYIGHNAVHVDPNCPGALQADQPKTPLASTWQTDDPNLRACLKCMG